MTIIQENLNKLENISKLEVNIIDILCVELIRVRRLIY